MPQRAEFEIDPIGGERIEARAGIEAELTEIGPAVSGGFQSPATIPRRAWLFLFLSGLATGASWLCYFRAMSLGQAAEVAPVEKISVVLVALFGVWFLG